MGIYRDNLDISSKQWFELLQDSSVFKDEDIALMKALNNCKDCREKASVLAVILGVSRHSVLNLQIGRLGKRIINKLPDVKFPVRKDGTIRYWHIPFWGENSETQGQYFWELRPELKEALDKLLKADKDTIMESEENTLIAEEIPEEELKNLFEGTKKQITVNAYERNQKARQICINQYGYKCSVCGFDFEEVYGDIGFQYIEVHHLKPLHEIGEGYQVDPVNDLRPVCPNCHAMLHRSDISCEELRKRLNK